MSEKENSEKEKIYELKKENRELKEMLQSRDIPLNKNLSNRVDKKMTEIEKSLGKAFCNSLGERFCRIMEGLDLKLRYRSGFSHSPGYWEVFITNGDQRQDVKNKIANIELEKLVETIDNFSWVFEEMNNQ